MRIGILSFPYGTNYGGVLQCYALLTQLRLLGHDAEFIRYTAIPTTTGQQLINTIKTSASFSSLLRRLGGRLKYIINRRDSYNQSKQEKFDAFRHDNFKFSEIFRPENISQNLSDTYDAIIVGSDQVWTDLASNDPSLFLGWEPRFKGLKISYAACSAHADIGRSMKPKFKKYFEDIDYLTVRDNTTANLVENTIGKRPEIVPDPTILHDFAELINNENTHGDYIITYILGNDIRGGHKKAIGRIRQLMGKPVKVIGIIPDASMKSVAEAVDECIYDASPAQWINLIANAQAVYTDSFHGLIFAMKFNIPFVGYYRDAIRSSRIIDLKNRYNLKGIVKKASDITTLSHHHLPVSDLKEILPILSQSCPPTTQNV